MNLDLLPNAELWVHGTGIANKAFDWNIWSLFSPVIDGVIFFFLTRVLYVYGLGYKGLNKAWIWATAG